LWVRQLVEEFGVVVEGEEPVAQQGEQRLRAFGVPLGGERPFLDAQPPRPESLRGADPLPRVEAHLRTAEALVDLDERGFDVAEDDLAFARTDEAPSGRARPGVLRLSPGSTSEWQTAIAVRSWRRPMSTPTR
jgi:hypothetical protein